MTKQKSRRCVDKNGDVMWKLPSGKLHRTDGPSVEFCNGSKLWHKNGKLHRLDGPAREWANGHKEWWVNGKRHRTDGPSVEFCNGSKLWHKNGKFHRLDGPAVEYTDGNKEWHKNGKFHRLDGPAVEYTDGNKEWYVDGKLHRLDGPAREWANGDKAWWKDDKLHRLDGPAVEYTDGTKEWWIGGVKYIEADWKEKVGKMTEQKSKKYMNETKLPDIRNAKSVVEIDIDVIATGVISDFIKENKNLIYSGEGPARVPFLRMNFERRKKIVSKFLDKLIAWGEAQS